MSPREDYGKGYGNFGKVIEKLFRMSRRAYAFLIALCLLSVGLCVYTIIRQEELKREQQRLNDSFPSNSIWRNP